MRRNQGTSSAWPTSPDVPISLQPLLSNIIDRTPDLQRYRRHLLGGCCRQQQDVVIKRRIVAFLAALPQYTSLLGYLLKLDEGSGEPGVGPSPCRHC